MTISTLLPNVAQLMKRFRNIVTLSQRIKKEMLQKRFTEST